MKKTIKRTVQIKDVMRGWNSPQNSPFTQAYFSIWDTTAEFH